MTTINWTDTLVSCFGSVRSIEPVNRKISSWLTSVNQPRTSAEIDRKNKVEEYRLTGNPKLKKKLPAFCPGAVLNTRSSEVKTSEKIKYVTGLMQFDIDGKDNKHVTDFAQLRDAIFTSEHVAFCSLSTSGDGVWGLILVKDHDDYLAHFRQLKTDFKWAFNIQLDSSKGGNPTDLRFYSYDPNAKLRIEPKLYSRKRIERKRVIHKVKTNNPTTLIDQVPELIRTANHKGLDIAPDYETYIRCGFALANEYGEQGRELFHLLCQPHSDYDSRKTDRQYSDCLKANNGSITIGTLIYLIRSVLPHG